MNRKKLYLAGTVAAALFLGFWGAVFMLENEMYEGSLGLCVMAMSVAFWVLFGWQMHDFAR